MGWRHQVPTTLIILSKHIKITVIAVSTVHYVQLQVMHWFVFKCVFVNKVTTSSGALKLHE